MHQSSGAYIALRVITIYFRSERKSRSGSRPCMFCLRERIILWRSFIERVINAISFSGNHFVIGTLCN